MELKQTKIEQVFDYPRRPLVPQSPTYAPNPLLACVGSDVRRYSRMIIGHVTQWTDFVYKVVQQRSACPVSPESGLLFCSGRWENKVWWNTWLGLTPDAHALFGPLVTSPMTSLRFNEVRGDDGNVLPVRLAVLYGAYGSQVILTLIKETDEDKHTFRLYE